MGFVTPVIFVVVFFEAIGTTFCSLGMDVWSSSRKGIQNGLVPAC